MKRILTTILVLSLMLTAAAIPAAQAASATQTSVAIGFEDGNIYAVGGSWCDREITDIAADGSSKALMVTTTNQPAGVGVKLKLIKDQQYNVSAKVYPIKCASGVQSGMKVWLLQDKSGYSSLQLSTLSGDEILPLNQWSTVSGIMTAKGTEDGTFEFRIGRNNNNNNGCKFIIDDIVITPVKKSVVDIDFDGSKLENKGTSGEPVMDATTGTYFNRRGGQAIRFTNIANQNALIRINNVLMKPNTTYKITYDIAQLKQNCIGKVIRLGLSRGGYHKTSDGTDAVKQLPNATSSLYTIPGTGWQKVTQYIKTSDPRMFDEVGYCNMFFEFFADESCTTRLSGDESLNFEMDNFKIEETDAPMDALFEQGQVPKYGNNNGTGEYNAAEGAIDVTTTGDVDMLLGVGMDNGVDYVISYDVKGTSGMKIRPYLNGRISDSLGKNESNGWTTLNGEWQSCTWKINYSCTPTVYPQLLIQAQGAGSYQIKNVKCVKAAEAGARAFTSSELNSGETALISFSDFSGSNAGYVYSVYAKNADGDKVIYASGMTTQKAVNYNVNAPAGTVLYAAVTAMSDDNSETYPVEVRLGTVQAARQFSIALNINYGADNPVSGSAVVQNDKNARKLRLFIAQYSDGGKKLIKVDSETFDIAANADSAAYTVDIKEFADETDSVRLFAWDENNMPYTGAISE